MEMIENTILSIVAVAYVICMTIIISSYCRDERKAKKLEKKRHKAQLLLQDKRCDNCGYDMYCASNAFPCCNCKRNINFKDRWISKEDE